MFPLSLYTGRLLAGSVILALVSIYAVVVNTAPEASMHLSPAGGVVNIGKPFSVSVLVESKVPVNAFSGGVAFDASFLRVEGITYNTEIADLWVEKPWYSAGDGEVQFAGGTTKSGGFTGSGDLITITFMPLAAGVSPLAIHNAAIYEHDGFGSAAELTQSIDSLFTIEALGNQARIIEKPSTVTKVAVVDEAVTFDLNGDGKVSLIDVSIFLLNGLSNDPRFDFNRDGTVDGADRALLLEARRSQ